MKKKKWKSENSRINKNFKNFVENKMLPGFAKFASFPILVTIRDTFSTLIPIIIAGSIGILGGTFIFGGGDGSSAMSTSIIGWIAKASGYVFYEERTGGQIVWRLEGGFVDVANAGNHLFSFINTATFSSFAIYTAFLIGYRWSVLKKLESPLMGGITSVAAFLIVSQANKFFFDATGLLMSIFISFLATQLYVMFAKMKRLRIKLPDSVPPAVANGFSALFPILFTLLIIAAINTSAYAIGLYANLAIENKGQVVFKPGEYGLAGLFFRFISAPFISFANSKEGGLGLGMLYIMMISVFWWFGIHGPSVLNGIFVPIWFGLILTNAESIRSGMSKFDSSLATFNMAFFESYVMTTGWGLTGALIVATLIFSKNKQHREISKISAPAAIFNINEPVTFGFPLIFDPIVGIAAVFAMPIATLIAWLFVGPLGWVSKSYIYPPWTMPPGVGAFISTGFDWRSILLALGIFLLMVLYYIPFVLLKNKYDLIQSKKSISVEQQILKGREVITNELVE